jgi:predicted ATP-dependent protease
VEAARTGKFHIWPVKTIEEGIEVLTGVPAGQLMQDGTFEKDSVFDKANQRLQVLADTLVKYDRD